MTPQKQDESGDISDHMAKGALWMVFLRWSMKVLGFFNVIILARILAPEDFGLIAMAMILIGLITTITDGNFDHSLLRKAGRSEEEYHTAWTAQILAGGLATLIIFALTPLLVAFFDEPRLYTVCFIAGLRPAIQGFENIGQVEFRRDFHFRTEFRYWITRQVMTIAIGLTLAFTLRNYLALALVMPLAALAAVGLSYRMSAFRPKFRLQGISDIISFSKWYALLDTVRFAGDKADELVVGRITSPLTLGHYYMASDIATMPTREITMPLDRALIPTLAHIAHDQQKMRESFAQSLAAVVTVCLALGVGLHFVSTDFVTVVLGAQWLPAIPFFEWLALYGAFSAITISTQSFFVVSEKLKVYATCYVVYMVTLIAALIITAMIIGITGIAPVRTFWMLGLLAVILCSAIATGLTTVRDITRLAWRPLIATAVMSFGLAQVQSGLATHTLMTLVIQILVGAGLYIGSLWLLWAARGRPPGIESSALAFLRKQLRSNA